MILFTDAEEKDVQRYLKGFNQYPFTNFDIEFRVMKVKAEELKCEVTDKPAKGMIDCDLEWVAKKNQELNGDQAVVISTKGSRGGAGSIPEIPITSPGETLVHEFMHVLGFGDEYEYSKELADIHCSPKYKRANTATFPPVPPYPSNIQARIKHIYDIPWYSDIFASTPIVTGKDLGTPSDHGQEIGLFQSGVCNKYTPKIHLWKPGGVVSNMEQTMNKIGVPNGMLLWKILEAKGIKRLETHYELRTSGIWPFRSTNCYLVDDLTGGKRINEKQPKHRCQVSDTKELKIDDSTRKGKLDTGEVKVHPSVDSKPNMIKK